jgi:N4-(beta-N-acetylglucosaminyl)-L-asparaginase
MMSLSRRSFMKLAAGMSALPVLSKSRAARAKKDDPVLPVIVCSRGEEWGRKVNRAGWGILQKGGSVLDAVEKGANVVELDPQDDSVGYGGLPNEEGVVQLDSCCMYGPTHNCGAVACLEGIKTPSSVARLVMERTDHMLIVGRGAQRFARAHGFKVENLLTEKARVEWLKWKENLSKDDDWFPPQDGVYRDRQGRKYGTINVLAVDRGGNLAGVTTTSGLSYKIPGRVGDSPIIGAGLYVDNQVGAAGATGRGEEVIRSCGSFYVVSQMRAGKGPTEACMEACKRIVEINKRAGTKITFSDKFIAVSKKGEVGCAAILGTKKDPPMVSVMTSKGFQAVTGEYLYDREGKNWD